MMEMVSFGLQTQVARKKCAVYVTSKFCIIQDETSTGCKGFFFFYRFSGVVGRVRFGQIEVVNMCSLRLLDTKTGMDEVGGKAGNPRALTSENSHLCHCLILFS
jgi:hypothetical protein